MRQDGAEQHEHHLVPGAEALRLGALQADEAEQQGRDDDGSLAWARSRAQQELEQQERHDRR